ncbi:MAG: hypothetical protein IJ567_12135 [Lachnospiraceae bacterium]|nr:hypothetical protein [Lachnospiraceae bacterium]
MAYGIYGISACQRVGAASFFYRGNADDRQKKNESDVKSQEFRDLLRRLKQTSQQEERVYSGMPQNKVNGFLELSGSPESKKKEIQKKATYNYNEVANKIQRAKTAVSAGQAVISAKRKVSEIRRKIASHDGNEEELQLALTHARRMEMVARKKKHNLETEEMVENIQKRDERQDKLEEAASNAEREKINAAEDQIADREDAVLEEREEMAHELAEQIGTRHIEISDDELAELNEMLAELGEDELKDLEEAMDIFESMEVVDPHMSKEELVNLKRRHRDSENKAIVKANLDYLKKMITISSGSSGASNTSGSAPVGSTSAGAGVSGAVNVPMPSVDVQL